MHHRPLALVLALLGATGCATLAPNLRGIYIAGDVQTQSGFAGAPAVVLIGDVGVPRGEGTRLLAEAVGRRLAGSPGTPVVLLGDVFYEWGLIGTCEGSEPPVSRPLCRSAGTPEAQLETALGPFRDALPDNPVIILAGNHDYYGGPEGMDAACRLVPAMAQGWRFLARGCGLDAGRPVVTVDTGSVALLLVDSEALLRDASHRDRALYGLHQTIRYYHTQEPEVWRVLAAHHPLESYGSHNGATLGNGLQKDLYVVRGTLLWPLLWPIERIIGPQNVFEWGYRSLRRDLYGMFRNAPIDVMVAGHDHSLQHVRIHGEGVAHQLISGAGSKRSGVQRFGLDLLWSNRIARWMGFPETLPSPKHDLAFAVGKRAPSDLAGYGFAVLVPAAEGLGVEFYDAARAEPLYATTLTRTPTAAEAAAIDTSGNTLEVQESTRP